MTIMNQSSFIKSPFLKSLLTTALLFSLVEMLSAQGQEPRLYQRWGKFGVGRLVTMVNNLNNIGDGQMRWPNLAHLPAMEYPYNPEEGGRHIHYATGISFHIGGYSLDLGPSYDPLTADRDNLSPRVESGDRTYYRYYNGFHFEGFPEFLSSNINSPLPLSNDPSTWPENGFPDRLPSRDWYHDSRFPAYQNFYQRTGTQGAPLPKDTSGFPGIGPNGEVLADQEFFAVNFSINRELVETPDIQNGKLMVYTTMHGLSYSGDDYDDFLMFRWTVTNIGNTPINRAYLGMLVDFDFPWASYRRFDSYNRVDNYAYDSTLQMVYGWDGDGTITPPNIGTWPRNVLPRLVDGTTIERASLAGVMFLQTPKVRNPIDSSVTNIEHGVSTWDAFYLRSKNTFNGMGSTAWRFYWNNIANRSPDGDGPQDGWDPDDLNRDGKDDWTWERPFPAGSEALYSNGYKCEFTINSGGSSFFLRPGETDTLVVAVVMGESRAQLFENALSAREIYELGYKPPRPPAPPMVRAYPSSNSVTLIWDDRSENDSLNLANGREPFEGYKLYRSSNGGLTWGDRFITDANGNRIDDAPIQQWDLQNGISGFSTRRPNFFIGNDTGLDAIIEVAQKDTSILERNSRGDTLFFGTFSAGQRTGRRIFVDRNLINGINYIYAVVAYSAGENIPGGRKPFQNGRTLTGNATQIVRVTPAASRANTASDLDLIRVVPNPYRGRSDFERSQNEGEIRFTRLPRKCTIKIFNSVGELVQTLQHDEASSGQGEGIARWNLRSRENRNVAPGLYFFIVESELGSKTGKFVIIR